MCNSYVVGHVSLEFDQAYFKILLLPGSSILCTVPVIPLMYQVRGHEKALQWLEKAINKILLQADDLTSEFKS